MCLTPEIWATIIAELVVQERFDTVNFVPRIETAGQIAAFGDMVIPLPKQAAATAGIVLGGILTQYVGWRALFLVDPPVIVILVMAMRGLLPAGGRNRSVHLDIPGALTATVSVAALIYGVSQGQRTRHGPPRSWSCSEGRC